MVVTFFKSPTIIIPKNIPICAMVVMTMVHETLGLYQSAAAMPPVQTSGDWDGAALVIFVDMFDTWYET